MEYKKTCLIRFTVAIPVVVTAFFLFNACSPKGPKPEQVTQEFLNAYLTTDFNKAATYCTEKLSGELLEAVKEIGNLSEPLKKHISESAGKFTSRVDNIDKPGNGDTLLVHYSILENGTDSTLAASGIISSSLSLIKDNSGGWKVAKLNK